MTDKIITSESDVDLDPESMTDNIDVNQSKERRLELIRELDAMINSPTSSTEKEKKVVEKKNCYIKFKSYDGRSEFNMNFNMIALNQSIHDRRNIDLSIESDEKRLIKLISFFQKNITKNSRATKKGKLNALKIFMKNGVKLKKKSNRKRRLKYKNDVFVTKLHMKVYDESIVIINTESDFSWKVTEMKYMFENNRPMINVLLTRT